jgi:hypothetical protein
MDKFEKLSISKIEGRIKRNVAVPVFPFRDFVSRIIGKLVSTTSEENKILTTIKIRNKKRIPFLLF